ncbi:MAG: hypothetical protein SFU27_02595 [Thermonemataceae bacterium]|nr:hypothetical protein [Thermonemataceae bacterium]
MKPYSASLLQISHCLIQQATNRSKQILYQETPKTTKDMTQAEKKQLEIALAEAKAEGNTADVEMIESFLKEAKQSPKKSLKEKKAGRKKNIPTRQKRSKPEVKSTALVPIRQAAKSKTNASAKTKAKSSKRQAASVNSISPQVRLIKRFVTLMNSKDKSTRSLENLLIAIKKDLANGKIKKNDAYAAQIMEIQKTLVKALNANTSVSIQVNPNDLENLKDMASSEKRLLSVTYLNSYLNLARSDKQEPSKMKALAKKIGNALEQGFIQRTDPYFAEMKKIFGKLNSGKITLDAEGLTGLTGFKRKKTKAKNKGLHGIETPEEMSVLDLENMELNGLGFSGEFGNFLGDVAAPFTAVVYGKPKTGKTYWNLMFADYLSRNFGKVLYVSAEEYGSPTLIAKLKEMTLDKKIIFRKTLPADVSKYDFVFVDSATVLEIEPIDIADLKKTNPNTSFIFVLQVTKDGNFRGSQEWTHNVDIIVITNDRGEATSKGRYGFGTMDIFETLKSYQRAYVG